MCYLLRQKLSLLYFSCISLSVLVLLSKAYLAYLWMARSWRKSKFPFPETTVQAHSTTRPSSLIPRLARIWDFWLWREACHTVVHTTETEHCWASGHLMEARAHCFLGSAQLSGIHLDLSLLRNSCFPDPPVSSMSAHFVVTILTASYRPSSFSLWSFDICPLCISACVVKARVSGACVPLVSGFVAAH